MHPAIPSIVVALAATFSLLGAPQKAKRPSQPKVGAQKPSPAKTEEETDIPVICTAWDDGPTQPDLLETEPSLSGSMTVPGASVPDLHANLQKLLVPRLQKEGIDFSGTTDRIREARQKMLMEMGDTILPLPKAGGLLFTVSDKRLKDDLKSITFIGSRLSGKVVGTVGAIWVEITPASVKWGDSSSDLRLRVDIHLSGNCTRGSEGSKWIVSRKLYSSRQLARAIAESLQPNSAEPVIPQQ